MGVGANKFNKDRSLINVIVASSIQQEEKHGDSVSHITLQVKHHDTIMYVKVFYFLI